MLEKKQNRLLIIYKKITKKQKMLLIPVTVNRDMTIIYDKTKVLDISIPNIIEPWMTSNNEGIIFIDTFSFALCVFQQILVKKKPFGNLLRKIYT